MADRRRCALTRSLRMAQTIAQSRVPITGSNGRSRGRRERGSHQDFRTDDCHQCDAQNETDVPGEEYRKVVGAETFTSRYTASINARACKACALHLVSALRPSDQYKSFLHVRAPQKQGIVLPGTSA